MPEVYNVYTDEETGFVCIVMEYVRGKSLDKAWASLSRGEKKSIIEQLRGYFNDFRQIKGPFIGGIDGSECDDQLFPDDVGGLGPYNDEGAFNRALGVVWWAKYSGDPFIRLICQMQRTVIKHLAARNILVESSKVVAVLD